MLHFLQKLFSLAWTPAAPRRARVHQRDYGSANSIDHFNPEFNAESHLMKNQSQPYLLTFQETQGNAQLYTIIMKIRLDQVVFSSRIFKKVSSIQGSINPKKENEPGIWGSRLAFVTIGQTKPYFFLEPLYLQSINE